MQLTKLSSAGQVEIPEAIRAAHAWESGAEFEVQDREDGVFLRARPAFAPTAIADVVGSAGYTGPRRSLEAMRRAMPPGIFDEA